MIPNVALNAVAGRPKEEYGLEPQGLDEIRPGCYDAAERVTDSAYVHVMLLSHTRRDTDYALACWDCSKNKIDELQLQITPAPGAPKFDAPGGFLFVNWERSRSSPAAS